MVSRPRPRPPRYTATQDPQRGRYGQQYAPRKSVTGEKVTVFAQSIINATGELNKLTAGISNLAQTLKLLQIRPQDLPASTAATAEPATRSKRAAAARWTAQTLAAVIQAQTQQETEPNLEGDLATGGTRAVGGILATKAVATIAPSLLATTTTAATGLGTAAGTAGAALAGLATALGAILLPLAAIAAAAGLVYAAMFKWQELPLWAKALLLVLSPLVVAIRACALAFNVAATAARIVTAPFRAVAAAAGLVRDTIVAIPNAIKAAFAAVPGLLAGVASQITSLAQRTAAAAGAMVRGVSAGLQTLGKWTAYAGGAMVAAAGALVGPAQMAADAYADFGSSLAAIAADYDLSTEAAAGLALASRLTGDSVADLADRMGEGSAASQAWSRYAAQLGLSLGTAGAAGAVSLSDAFSTLKAAAAGFWIQLGSAVAPAIQETTQLMVGAIQIATRWVTEHKPLIATAFRIASGVAIAGSAIVSLGGVIAGAGAIISPLTAGLAVLAGGLAVVEVRTGAGRGFWAAYGDSLRSVYGTVVDYGSRIVRFASGVFSGVTDAVRAGRLDLAVTIAWSAAQLAWIKGLSELSSLTSGAFSDIAATLAAGNLADSAQALWLGIQIAFTAGVGALDSVWTGMVNGFEEALRAMAGYAASFLGQVIDKLLMPMSFMENKFTGTSAIWGAKTELDNARQGLEQFSTAAPSTARYEALEDRAAKRSQQIAALEAQLSALRTKSDTDSAAKATALEQRLNTARAEAEQARADSDAEATRRRDLLDQATAASSPGNGTSIGTFSGWMTAQVFSQPQQIAEKQLEAGLRTANAVEAAIDLQRRNKGLVFA